VLEDGASSLYGSDAIAGVVNIITRRDFDGAQVSLNYGEFEEGDGETAGVDLAWGGSTDRASWFVAGSFFDQEEVASIDRERTRVPVFGTGNALGSSRVPGTLLLHRSAQSAAGTTSPPIRRSTIPPIPGLPNCAGGADAGRLPLLFGRARRVQLRAVNLVQTPNERAGVFGQFRFDLNESTTLYARALLNRRRSTNQAAPEPIDIGPAAGPTRFQRRDPGQPGVQPVRFHP
jgi:iron complex outermembrane receptor protein